MRARNSLGRTADLFDSAETTLEAERGGNGGVDTAVTDPSLEGNGGGGGRRFLASA